MVTIYNWSSLRMKSLCIEPAPLIKPPMEIIDAQCAAISMATNAFAENIDYEASVNSVVDEIDEDYEMNEIEERLRNQFISPVTPEIDIFAKIIESSPIDATPGPESHYLVLKDDKTSTLFQLLITTPLDDPIAIKASSVVTWRSVLDGTSSHLLPPEVPFLFKRLKVLRRKLWNPKRSDTPPFTSLAIEKQTDYWVLKSLDETRVTL